MNDFSIELPTLVMATLTMSLSALIAMAALSWFKPSGHRIYRLVWFAVIINGIMLARYSIDLPVLNEKSSTSLASLLGANEPEFVGSFLEEGVLNGDYREASSEPNSRRTSTDSDSNQLPLNAVSAGEIPINASAGIDWGWVTISIWIAGVVVSLGWLLFQYIAFVRLANEAKPASKAWQHDCDDTCREVALARPLPLYVHEHLGPALYLTVSGYRIVVPAKLWSKMEGEQRSAIIRHEVEHCRRLDVFTSLFAFVVASIHWFNPFAWIAVRQLNQAAEWACDDAAVTNQTQQSLFARALLSISTSNSKHLIGVHGVGNFKFEIAYS